MQKTERRKKKRDERERERERESERESERDSVCELSESKQDMCESNSGQPIRAMTVSTDQVDSDSDAMDEMSDLTQVSVSIIMC